MQLEVGSILEGKVTGITKFGAFVELPGGKVSMVHISEVAPTFVKEIRDFVKENQVVKVKVLSISDDGKVSLSMKKAMEPSQRPSSPAQRSGRPGGFNRSGPRPSANRPGIMNGRPAGRMKAVALKICFPALNRAAMKRCLI